MNHIVNMRFMLQTASQKALFHDLKVREVPFQAFLYISPKTKRSSPQDIQFSTSISPRKSLLLDRSYWKNLNLQLHAKYTRTNQQLYFLSEIIIMDIFKKN